MELHPGVDEQQLHGTKHNSDDGRSATYHEDPSGSHDYTIDVISIGSEASPENLQAQLHTWAGSHGAVRRFWGFTEKQNVNQNCPDISAEDLANLVWTCRTGSGFDPLIAGHVSRYYGEGLEDYAKEAGWLCAQRRIGSLLGWLQEQYAGGARGGGLPDLLVYVGDDTFLDLNQVRRYMTHQALYAKGRPLARAACVIQEDRHSEITFSFPYGVYGTFFDKNALHDMIRPIRCVTSNDISAFNKRICSTLKEDRVGELRLFKEGMTILQLFHKYSTIPVYCMHSDWILGYILKYYLLQESALLGMDTYPRCGTMTSVATELPCEDTFTSCHSMQPEDMESLSLSSYVRAPDSFRSLPHLAKTTAPAVAGMLSEKKAVQEVRSGMLLPNVLLIGTQKAGTTSVSA